MFIKKVFKDPKKLKYLEIMYQNAIYICIFWYSKICWFPMKKFWCRHNLRGVPRDSYNFWVFFRSDIIVPSFIFVGYAWQVLGGRGGGRHFEQFSIREQPRKGPSWIGLQRDSSTVFSCEYYTIFKNTYLKHICQWPLLYF